MGRKANITRYAKLTICLPGDVHAKLELYLFSPAQGRVPYGAWQEFFTERTNEFFARQVPAPTPFEKEAS